MDVIYRVRTTPYLQRIATPTELRSLRGELADVRGPIAQSAACVAAAADRSSQVLRQRAGLSDVLGRDPDAIADHRGGTVVAPAHANGVGENLRPIGGEAVVQPDAFGDDMHIAC